MTRLTQILFWLMCLPLLSLARPAHALPQAAAVVDDGYAGKVLQKILDTGKLKFGQKMNLRLSLDDQGHLLECRANKNVDANAVCAAAKAASPFGIPPYGVPTYLTLALWTGQPPKAQPETKAADVGVAVVDKPAQGKTSAWLAKIRHELRDSMYIPAQTKPGTYHVTARIKCDAEGKIVDYAIIKGSGDKTLDKYCLQGIKRLGKVDPPPVGAGDSHDLKFTLVRQ